MVKRGVGKSAFVVSLLVVGVVAFTLGTRNNTLLSDISLRLSGKTASSQLDFNSLQQTYSVLAKNFDGKLSSSALVEGANRGLVEAAGDPYTTYFDAKEAAEFNESLEGTFSGIGAELGKTNDKLSVISTLDDSPAKKAGLLAGDVIVRVNGIETTSWSVDKAVAEIRGQKGTTVKISLIRGEQEVKEFDITRDVITDPSVKSEIKNGVGIMRISRFGEKDTEALARAAAQDFAAQKVRGVVLDLRGNGGGFLEAAVDISSIWLNNKVVVTERTGGKVVDELKSGNDAPLLGVPTVVLIDGGSASASEIVAGALRDNKAATLVGAKSFGKGSVQSIVDLFGGALLKVTIAKWFTPSGQTINGKGITPDVAVEFTQQNAQAKQDPQLDKALELLN